MTEARFSTKESIDAWFEGAMNGLVAGMTVELEKQEATSEEVDKRVARTYVSTLRGLNIVRESLYKSIGEKAPQRARLKDVAFRAVYYR